MTVHINVTVRKSSQLWQELFVKDTYKLLHEWEGSELHRVYFPTSPPLPRPAHTSLPTLSPFPRSSAPDWRLQTWSRGDVLVKSFLLGPEVQSPAFHCCLTLDSRDHMLPNSYERRLPCPQNMLCPHPLPPMTGAVLGLFHTW